MDHVARLPLGGRRFEPWVRSITFTADQDLSDAAFRMQLRETRNAPGAPLVDLHVVGDDQAEGITVVRVVPNGRRFKTTIALRIAEATMRGLPYMGEIGDDVVLPYDFQVTPAGLDKAVWMEGEFWALAAVTGADTAADPGGVSEGARQRPDFGGSAQFQIGTSTIQVDVRGGPGPRGRDAAPPDRVDIIAVAGQTRFPATGDFSQFGFSYDDGAVIELNSEELLPIDFTAPGGVEPVILTSGADEGDGFTIHSFKLTGPDPSTGLDRLGFAVHKSARQKMQESIALDDAWQRNDPDHVNALLSLGNDGYRKIMLPGTGRGGLDRSGDYELFTGPWTNPEAAVDGFDALISAPGNIRSGMQFIGDGMDQTRVYTRGKGYAFMINTRSGDAGDCARDLLWRDLSIHGNVEAGLFDEHNHLVALAGVRRAFFERVGFFGWQGDAAYLTHGFKPTDVAPNFDVAFLSCFFDGIVRENRNAISGESIDGLRVLYSHFQRMTKAGYPGPIDIEPLRETTADQARAIVVTGNTFSDYGGAAVTLNAGPPDHYPGGVSMQVLHNTMRDGLLGVDVFGGLTPATIGSQANDHQLHVAGNILERVSKPMRLRGACGVTYTRNSHVDVDAILLGNLEGYANRRIHIEWNDWLRGGLATGAVLLHDDTSIDCSFSNNNLVDCGVRSGQSSIPVIGRKGDVDLRLNYNRVSDPNHRLVAFAAMGNQVGVISPKSEKVGNQFPDGAPPSAGNFNPPPPVRGIVATYTSNVQEVIQPGQASIHDLGCAGATIGMQFRTYLPSRQPEATDIYLAGGYARDTNIVRLVVKNEGTAAITLPAGTVIMGVEA